MASHQHLSTTRSRSQNEASALAFWVEDSQYQRLVGSNRYMDCRPFKKEESWPPSYSVDEIISLGIVAGNGCGKRSSEAVRGELILFVRPFT